MRSGHAAASIGTSATEGHAPHQTNKRVSSITRDYLHSDWCGVGFVAQGFRSEHSLHTSPGQLDPHVQFAFEGIEQPRAGQRIQDHGRQPTAGAEVEGHCFQQPLG